MKLTDIQKDLIIAKAMQKASGICFNAITAPQFSEQMYEVAEHVSGVPDPYRPLRFRQNNLALEKLDFLREKIEYAPDPLLQAGYFALLGNMIDYGGVRLFDESLIFDQLDKPEFTVNDYQRFRELLLRSNRLLILGDNAGEGVFDLLFIEQIKKFRPGADICYGVRSKPAINDMLLEDAEYIGLPAVALVLETGSTCAGTIVSQGTPRFREIYYSSDMIISKGQGNFETLEREPENIFFIFKVKCPVIAEYIHLPEGASVFAFRDTLFSLQQKMDAEAQANYSTKRS